MITIEKKGLKINKWLFLGRGDSTWQAFCLFVHLQVLLVSRCAAKVFEILGVIRRLALGLCCGLKATCCLVEFVYLLTYSIWMMQRLFFEFVVLIYLYWLCCMLVKILEDAWCAVCSENLSWIKNDEILTWWHLDREDASVHQNVEFKDWPQF